MGILMTSLNLDSNGSNGLLIELTNEGCRKLIDREKGRREVKWKVQNKNYSLITFAY